MKHIRILVLLAVFGVIFAGVFSQISLGNPTPNAKENPFINGRNATINAGQYEIARAPWLLTYVPANMSNSSQLITEAANAKVNETLPPMPTPPVHPVPDSRISWCPLCQVAYAEEMDQYAKDMQSYNETVAMRGTLATINVQGTFNVRLAVAGDPSYFTPENLAWYKAQGFTEVHIVPSDLLPHADVCQNIRAAGMWPVYDAEYSLWASRGFSTSDINWARDALAQIKASGWVAMSSEGLTNAQISVIRGYLPFISYGGDSGTNLYTSMYYANTYDSHAANYVEYYYLEFYQYYYATFAFDYKMTPHNMGLTLGLWGSGSARPATLSLQPSYILQLLKQAYADKMDVNHMTFLFWTGAGNNPRLFLEKDPWGYGGEFVPTLKFIQSLNGVPYNAPMK